MKSLVKEYIEESLELYSINVMVNSGLECIYKDYKLFKNEVLKDYDFFRNCFE